MNNGRVNIDITALRIIYGRYKVYILPVLVIAVCLVLFLTVILPQLQYFLTLKDKRNEEAKKFYVLQNNLSVLSSLNDVSLASNLSVLSLALPPGKDFGSILNGISQAANNSGVALGDFDFRVGDISSSQSARITGAKGFPSLTLTLNLNSGVAGTLRFIKELSKVLPLSSVTSIDYNSNSSKITTVFYYKPFPPLEFNDTTPIETISQKDQTVIDKISSLNNNTFPQPVFQVSSTSSALPSSSPF